VGVLALQGDFEAHQRALQGLGAGCRDVRQPPQLEGLQALVIPGGESTTLIKLMQAFDFWEPLRAFVASGRPVFGTCAGAILLASEVLNPSQACLGAVDITVERNSYGRQRDSFEGAGPFRATAGDEREIEMVFIRAPRITRLGAGVETLAECRGDAVMARQDHLLVATFHPELSPEPHVHRYFLDMVDAADSA
jgi:5'-phosphate synthase pdxT subunit